MKRKRIGLLACLWMMLACVGLRAEKVADLPEPTTYVNDFAHVITAEDAQRIEELNRELHDQAKARVVIVTINTLDDGKGGTQTKEEFAAALEEKWKLGKKGEDRSVLLLFVKSPPKRWIEIGYGLEGDLNDAKVGAILDSANEPERAGNFSQAIVMEDQGLADVIAKAANVTLAAAQPAPTYHEQTVPAPPLTGAQRAGSVVVLLVVLVVVYLLYKTGNLGLIFLLLNMFSGGGGGGGGGGNDDNFSEGGGSGGGGAGRDF